MKICLLANPRSGSTSLFTLIQSHLSDEYHCISEPFNSFYMGYSSDTQDHLNEIKTSENVFFKHICYQYPTEFETKELWYDWLFNNFDKIILLDRKDKRLQSESFVYHESKNRPTWHIRSYYDLSNIDESKIQERIDLLEKDGLFLIEKSKEYPMFYYEDLFVKKDMEIINNVFSYLEITPIQKYIDRHIISETKKVRIFVDKRTLL